MVQHIIIQDEWLWGKGKGKIFFESTGGMTGLSKTVEPLPAGLTAHVKTAIIPCREGSQDGSMY
jgi:hypothetical protein